MAIRRIKVRGRKVWQARIAYRGVRKSALRDTREAVATRPNQIWGREKLR